jgi:hypothetical protein
VLNCWYYHGIGKGGSLSYSLFLHQRCTVGDFLKKVNNNVPLHQPASMLGQHQENIARKIEILSERTIRSLRHQCKLSSAGKDIKTSSIGVKDAVLFDGFFDFLSFIIRQKNQLKKDVDFVVLNLLSFLEKYDNFLEQHDIFKLHLGQDKSGQNYSHAQYLFLTNTKMKAICKKNIRT